MRSLKAKQIVTQVHYIPVPAHPHYQRLGFKIEDYPKAKSYYQDALSIPLFVGLKDEDQQLVVNSLGVE